MWSDGPDNKVIYISIPMDKVVASKTEGLVMMMGFFQFFLEQCKEIFASKIMAEPKKTVLVPKSWPTPKFSVH